MIFWLGFLIGAWTASIGWMVHEIYLMKQCEKHMQDATETLRVASAWMKLESWKN